jgi:hypothetical protein
MLAAADAGQAVVASVLGLGAAGVAGGVVAMAWSLHLHQLQLAARLARRDAGEPDARAGPAVLAGRKDRSESSRLVDLADRAENAVPVPAVNGHGPGRPASSGGAGTLGGGEGPRASPPSVIEGPDSVVIGEQARYRVRRSGVQQVVAWSAGGSAVSQATDPAHPEDLLLVADQPGLLTISVRLREGLAERRETRAVTAVANPETATPAVASRLLLRDWPVITVAVLAVGFAAALVAVGSLPVADFIALVTPLVAVLAVVSATRGTSGRTTR